MAFAESPDEIPPDPWSGDPEAAAYWAGDTSLVCLPEKAIYYEKGGRWNCEAVGRGNTPEEAVADLDRRNQDKDDREWTKGDTRLEIYHVAESKGHSPEFAGPAGYQPEMVWCPRCYQYISLIVEMGECSRRHVGK